jgi:hypothetical protein
MPRVNKVKKEPVSDSDSSSDSPPATQRPAAKPAAKRAAKPPAPKAGKAKGNKKKKEQRVPQGGKRAREDTARKSLKKVLVLSKAERRDVRHPCSDVTTQLGRVVRAQRSRHMGIVHASEAELCAGRKAIVIIKPRDGVVRDKKFRRASQYIALPCVIVGARCGSDAVLRVVVRAASDPEDIGRDLFRFTKQTTIAAETGRVLLEDWNDRYPVDADTESDNEDNEGSDYALTATSNADKAIDDPFLQ